MGYWLHKYFKSRAAFDNVITGTEVFDLPKKGIISNLMLEINATAGNVNLDIYLADAISKVEVIGNGSTVIQSLDGRQIQASAAHDDKMMPPDKEYSPSGACYGYFDIRFGRFVGDQKYALDCSKWDSLELKITYDLAAGGTIGTTGFTTTTGYLTLYGLFSPDGAGLSPVGYIKKEEKKVYVTSADGTEDLELPNDYPYRRLLLFEETHAHFPHEAFKYVTININNGARKVIDNVEGEDLIMQQLAIAGNPTWRHSKQYYMVAGNNTIHPPIGWASGASFFGSGYLVTVTSFDVAATNVQIATTNFGHGTFWGWCPWRSLIIDLERQSGKDGQAAMMDCWGFGQAEDIHLEHTQQTASLASSVVLEQYATPPK